ncbi:MAG TPA: transcriptional repressor [Mycobacteriales bacterium]
MRSTPQRRAVLEVIERATDHPTAAEVIARVNDLLPGVGAATVYRTLGWLVSTGQVAELRLGGTATRYDRNIDHHEHLVCDRCGGVEDVVLGLDPPQFLASLPTRGDFTVTGYDLRVHGVCHRCDVPGPTTDFDPKEHR